MLRRTIAAIIQNFSSILQIILIFPSENFFIFTVCYYQTFIAHETLLADSTIPSEQIIIFFFNKKTHTNTEWSYGKLMLPVSAVNFQSLQLKFSKHEQSVESGSLSVDRQFRLTGSLLSQCSLTLPASHCHLKGRIFV